MSNALCVHTCCINIQLLSTLSYPSEQQQQQQQNMFLPFTHVSLS